MSHKNCSYIKITSKNGSHEFITSKDVTMHSYVHKSASMRACFVVVVASFSQISSLKSLLAASMQDYSWNMIKHAVYEIHRQVRDRSPNPNVKVILIRNRSLNIVVKGLLIDVVGSFPGRRCKCLLQITGKVLLSSRNSSLTRRFATDCYILTRFVFFFK